MTATRTGVQATPDETLVALARAGDRPAEEILFGRHFEVAYRVAHRLLGHDQDALDAVQDSYVKVLGGLGSFDGRCGFRTWLLRIVTNTALDAGRRRQRNPLVRLSEVDLDRAGAEEDPSRGLQREDLRNAIDAALARLSPAKRTTFVLFAEAGLTYEEIAECLKVPKGTVMSRISDARQKLQAYLEGIDEH
ncbi:MAG TPA: RNA polymerase sigma factor [Isosphaeraceae bacterium]|nr:RNA polymerase sigma factor [Isosphaeraceae bacterium]